MTIRSALLVAGAACAAILLPTTAEAQSYRCVGKDGKKYYGQALPPQCVGQPAEVLNPQGMVIRRLDPQASAAERAVKEADDAERKKRELVSKEEGRRNRALLATYTSEKDIEEARGRALKDNEAAVKDIERRIALMKKQQLDASKELEFYTGKNKPPATLEQRLKNLQFDIQTQEGLLAAKKKEDATINSRYDDDKRRYLELTKGTTTAPKKGG
jgi:hypothetical protein